MRRLWWVLPLALAGAVLLAMVAGRVPAGAQTAPTVAVGSVSVTTDANGYVTVPHTLGTVPTYVAVTPQGTIAGCPCPIFLGADSLTATSFRARFVQTALNSLGTALGVYASKTLTVEWEVANPSPPPSSTTTTTVGAANRSGLPWPSYVHTGSTETDYTAFETWRSGGPNGQRLLDGNLQYTARDTWAHLESPWFANDYPGRQVIAQPFFPTGLGNITDCAAGVYDSHWATYGSNLVARGQPDAVTELDWEFNLNPANMADPTHWVGCWRHVVAAIRSTAPQARFSWTMNSGSPDPTPLYPGNDVVDIVGTDFYDMWPASLTEATWTQKNTQVGGLQWTADFAAAHGKPWAAPEWGLAWTNLGGGQWGCDSNHGCDNPFFVTHVQDFIRSHAGGVAFESYFNATGGTRSRIFPTTENPNAAAAYLAGLHG